MHFNKVSTIYEKNQSFMYLFKFIKFIKNVMLILLALNWKALQFSIFCKKPHEKIKKNLGVM